MQAIIRLVLLGCRWGHQTVAYRWILRWFDSLNAHLRLIRIESDESFLNNISPQSSIILLSSLSHFTEKNSKTVIRKREIIQLESDLHQMGVGSWNYPKLVVKFMKWTDRPRHCLALNGHLRSEWFFTLHFSISQNTLMTDEWSSFSSLPFTWHFNFVPTQNWIRTS